MTPEAIGLIKASYIQVTAKPRQLAGRFYDELFAVAPNLRPLFPGDLTLLQGHFEAALALVVRNLDDMSALRESLRDLVAHHVKFGARPEDYIIARAALVAAIGGLSPSWDPALDRHWRAAITDIIVPMLQGAAVHTALVAECLAAEGSECA